MKKDLLIILMVIGILSIFVVPFSLSIYKSSAATNTNLTSADWNVSINQSGVNNYLSIVPNGNTADYTLNIRSTSKVDVRYSIIISNLPSNTSVSLDGGAFVSETNNQVEFTNAGTILYSDVNKEKTHILTFSAASNSHVTNNQQVDIDVVVKQII